MNQIKIKQNFFNYFNLNQEIKNKQNVDCCQNDSFNHFNKQIKRINFPNDNYHFMKNNIIDNYNMYNQNMIHNNFNNIFEQNFTYDDRFYKNQILNINENSSYFICNKINI